MQLNMDFHPGGKPQFFFLVLINKLKKREFKKIFKKSRAKEEFKDDLITNITSFRQVISPEYISNFLYALEYIQTQRKINTAVLRL